MQPGLFSQQGFLVFYVVRIGNTAVNRTNGCALRLLMKTDAFGAFIRYDITEFLRNRHLFCFATHYRTISKINLIQAGAIAPGPRYPSFVNRGVRAFRLDVSTVDTFVCDYYSLDRPIINIFIFVFVIWNTNVTIFRFTK